MSEYVIDLCTPLHRGAPLPAGHLRLVREIGARWLIERDPEPVRSGDYVLRICGLRNRLMARVTAPWVLWLDGDTVLEPEAVTEAIRWLEDRPEWAGCGFRPEGAEPEYRHVGAGRVLLRAAALVGFSFSPYYEDVSGVTRRTCECGVLTRWLLGRGRSAAHAIRWRYDYHPTLTCVHERRS